jgi:hypothetical protein
MAMTDFHRHQSYRTGGARDASDWPFPFDGAVALGPAKQPAGQKVIRWFE